MSSPGLAEKAVWRWAEAEGAHQLQLPGEPRLGGGTNCCFEGIQLTDPHVPITAGNQTNWDSSWVSPKVGPPGGLSPG